MLPSASGASVPGAAEAGRRRGRRIAIAILAICAAPTVAAWFAYFVWPPQSQGNYGELIDPHPMSDYGLHRPDGGPFQLSQLRGKWVLLTFDSGACGEPCQKRLLYIRQARLAQGKDAGRIERLWMLSDAIKPEGALLAEHPGMHLALVSGSRFVAEFPAARDPADHIYVIDPLGNLMLRFPRDPDPRRLIKDLARLLKASRVG
jgi:cytochrome oxidase Cu insertion factor (SCO1/SenC/PrrC family)